MSNKYFCENCRNDMDQYDLFMEPMVINIDGINYEYVGRTARCIECGSEIYVPEVMDFNLEAINIAKKKGSDIHMTKFIVEIKEILEHDIEIEAKDEFEAIEKVRARYNNEEIILYPEDSYIDTEFSVIESFEQN